MRARLSIVILLTHCLLMMGCSSAPYQRAELIFSEITQNDKSFEIDQVPLLEQEPNQCGAAALATLLKFQGKNVQQQSLYDELYVPNKKGSYQSELIAFTRQYDLLPYARTSSIFELLTEINQSKPSLVLLNLGLEQFPAWHYAVITGYNGRKKTMTMHSGKASKTNISLKRFEKAWRLANHWTLSVHSIDHLPTYAYPDIIQRALADFETLGKTDLALAGYRNVLKLWPNQDESFLGMGNILFSKGNYEDAIQNYKQALSLSEQKVAILHNLSLAYQRNEQFEKAYNTILSAKQLNTENENHPLAKKIEELKVEIEQGINSKNI